MNSEVKRTATRLILFLLPIAAIMGYVEYRSCIMPNSYRIKKEQLATQAGEVRVLVLGSSNAYKDVDPSCFSLRGYNLANSSQTLFYDARLCRLYLDRMPALCCVVICLSGISYYFELNQSPDDWRAYFYYRYFGIRAPSLDLTDPKAYFCTALYPRKIILTNLIDPLRAIRDMNDLQNNGWEKAPIPTDPEAVSDSTGRLRYLFHETLVNSANTTMTTRYLIGLINELQQRGISVVLVTPPVSATYYKWFDPKYVRENQRLSGMLCSRFGIRYYDYFRDPRFTREDFYDNDHLNFKGAQKFSSILESEVLETSAKGRCD